MRLYIKHDYSGGLLIKAEHAGPIVAALDGIIKVREEGYGAERKFVPTDDTVSVEIIKEDHVGLPDATDSETWVKAYQQAQKEKQELKVQVSRLEKQIKDAAADNKKE